MFKKFINIFGVSHVVIAVCCMLVGVIVEFHQVHIYKNNISFWQIQATKTVSKDTKKSIQAANSVIKLLKSDFFECNIQTNGTDVKFHLSELTIYSRSLFDLITSEYHNERSLRGPPSV